MKKSIFSPLDNALRKVLKADYREDYVKHARILLLILCGILLLPIVLTQLPVSICSFTETGQIGDTIGGITAPFIGIIAGYLTFLAFHEQYRANVEAKNDLAKERFESKLYYFLSLLNDLEINTTIPKVGNYKQAYHFMFYEFKAIAVLVYRKLDCPDLNRMITYIDSDKQEQTVSMRNYILIQAFTIFINGVSTTSTSRLGEYLTGQEDYNDYFLWLQYKFREPKNKSVPYLDDYNTIRIKLFDGHRLRLVPFFRLFCKILELIYDYKVIRDNKVDEIASSKERELYLSTLLSILSEHQLALLKMIYIHDSKEHNRFIITHKDEIDHFFKDLYDKDNPMVCINKYIFTDIMDCTKDKFINYKNKIGELKNLNIKGSNVQNEE